MSMDAADWDRRYADHPWMWSADPNLFLVSEVGVLPPGRALDLGCGQGRDAVWLAERGWAVTGVDFSSVAIDRARLLAKARRVEAEFHVADVTTWKPDGSFDLVVVLYLHLPAGDMDAVLATAVESTGAGGTLLIVGHDRDNLEHGHGGPRDPDLLYSVDRMVAACDGLDIVRAAKVTRGVQDDGEVHTAFDTLVRAVRPPEG